MLFRQTASCSNSRVSQYHSTSAGTEDDGCSNASDVCGETRDHTFVTPPNRYNTEPDSYTLTVSGASLMLFAKFHTLIKSVNFHPHSLYSSFLDQVSRGSR